MSETTWKEADSGEIRSGPDLRPLLLQGDDLKVTPWRNRPGGVRVRRVKINGAEFVQREFRGVWIAAVSFLLITW